MRTLLIVLFICLTSTTSFATRFLPEADYQVCFTPAEPCTNLIVAAIARAQKEILVQAYSFTSAPIAKALVAAHKKGVNVRIILDRSQFKNRGFSSAKFFNDYQLPVMVDFEPNIAHNKVMIIDDKVVITGSFNFTRAAQEKNTENVLIISDAALAKKYKANWKQRESASALH